MIAIVLSSVVSAVVCVGIYVLVTRFITKNTIRAQREAALKEAEAEGEMIKKERILQAKEKFIQLKSDYDRQVNERNQKLAQSEQRQADRGQPAGISSANWRTACARTNGSKSRWKRSGSCWNIRPRRSTA